MDKLITFLSLSREFVFAKGRRTVGVAAYILDAIPPLLVPVNPGLISAKFGTLIPIFIPNPTLPALPLPLPTPHFFGTPPPEPWRNVKRARTINRHSATPMIGVVALRRENWMFEPET